MNLGKVTIFATADRGLAQHWQDALFGEALVAESFTVLRRSIDLDSLIWLDLNLPGAPTWDALDWKQLLEGLHLKVVACSSSPSDDDGIAALDAGCVAYCHAYSDQATLRQIKQVVEAGQIWIGTNLMQKLIRGAKLARRPSLPSADGLDWSVDLTPREKEVAVLAANGASNQLIARNCSISERTVKAHLSAVFQKLNITDRLQLALRVHGIS